MRLLLAVIGALAIIAAIAAAGFFFGGFYNVAASEDDPQIVSWALPKVRTAAIDRHSAGLKPPTPLDDPATVQAGAPAVSPRRRVNCPPGAGRRWGKISGSPPPRSPPA